MKNEEFLDIVRQYCESDDESFGENNEAVTKEIQRLRDICKILDPANDEEYDLLTQKLEMSKTITEMLDKRARRDKVRLV